MPTGDGALPSARRLPRPFGTRLSRRVAARALAALGMVALAATLLAAPASATTYVTPAVPVHTATERAIITQVLRELNHERVVHHLPTLVADPHLQISARRHNVMMAKFNDLSHQLPTEAIFTSRIRTAGYKWSWAGENVAYNTVMTTSGAITLEKMMYGERPPNDGHRVNILSTHYRNVGVDVLLDTKHHKLWLTTDFGRH